MLYFKFERLLGGRQSRKIGNNTWLHARSERSNNYIALQHFCTELVQAFPSGQTVVKPFYSVTSMRRLYAHVPRFWRQRGMGHYRDPSGVEHLTHSRLILDADGFVEYTDYTPPPPAPVWIAYKREAKALIRAHAIESFNVWMKNPVRGCVRCPRWAQQHVETAPMGATLWRAFETQNFAQTIPTCFWHSSVLNADDRINAFKFLWPSLKLDARKRVLRKTKTRWIQAAVEFMYARLSVA
jgi:hypothetical protein